MLRIIRNICFLLLLGAASAGCSGHSSQPVPDTTAAYNRGLNDAKALSSANYQEEMDLHTALLAVKSREWQLRDKGDFAGADAYIDGFRTYLTENDKSLADKIF